MSRGSWNLLSWEGLEMAGAPHQALETSKLSKAFIQTAVCQLSTGPSSKPVTTVITHRCFLKDSSAPKSRKE